jgi:hypothetical protein
MTNLPNISGVVRVGGGRGFVVRFRFKRWLPAFRQEAGRYVVRTELRIVTAAHCLPKLLPPHAWSHLEERTYKNLVGVLGKKRNVWAECLFADPIADIAVLGCPDNQELSDQADAYNALVESVKPLKLGEPELEKGSGWPLSLDKPYRWLPTPTNCPNVDCLLTGQVEAGMSGSPVLNSKGQAVAVAAIGGTLNNGYTGTTGCGEALPSEAAALEKPR